MACRFLYEERAFVKLLCFHFSASGVLELPERIALASARFFSMPQFYFLLKVSIHQGL